MIAEKRVKFPRTLHPDSPKVSPQGTPRRGSALSFTGCSHTSGDPVLLRQALSPDPRRQAEARTPSDLLHLGMLPWSFAMFTA